MADIHYEFDNTAVIQHIFKTKQKNQCKKTNNILNSLLIIKSLYFSNEFHI